MKKDRVSAGLIAAAVLVGVAVGILPPLLTGITGLWFITPVLAGLIVLGIFLRSQVLVLLPGVLTLASMVLTAFLSPMNLSDVQREEHTAMGNFIKGEVLWVRNDFQGAATAYREAKRLGIDHPWVSYQLASCYSRGGDAYSGFQELMRLQKEYPDFPMWLIKSDYAKLLVAVKNYGKAEEEFWSAIRSHYNPAEVYFNFGVYHLMRGEIDDAADKITKSHRLGYDRSACSVLLGKIHEKRGEVAAAEELYRRALRESEENIEAYTRLGLLLSRYQRRYVEAEELFKQGMIYLGWMPLPNRRVGAEFLGAYGENYARMDQPGKAEAMFQLAINTDPTWMEGYLKLADIYAGTGRIPAAVAILEAAWAFNPSYYPVKQLLDKLTAPPVDTSQ